MSEKLLGDVKGFPQLNIAGHRKTRLTEKLRKLFAPPHPTWQSSVSRDRVRVFLEEEEKRVPHGFRINVGSASKRFEVHMLNLDLVHSQDVDVRGDLLHLPIQDGTVDTLVCTGVLEHVSDPHQAVKELYRILKSGGKVFVETPFMQTVHASPDDYSRWTPHGLRRLLKEFEVLDCQLVAGPGSALAWQFQETMAMLCSFHTDLLYRVGLRIFGWLAVPMSWLDIVLEHHPMAWHAASGYAVVGVKPQCSM